MSRVAEGRFFGEFTKMLNSNVKVITEKTTYTGVLLGYDRETMAICLKDATDTEGTVYKKLVIYGRIISEIVETKKAFDLKKLAEDLQVMFPRGEVKLDTEADAIIVLNKIKVSEKGVQGSGPLAERVRTVYDKFIETMEAGGEEEVVEEGEEKPGE
ncbi:MAG: Lsm family RNA-binding protein [Candidatus Helarchaeota archaeon]|nr:Lsm family RNA-binding protein [Candidatus Helarchaeota archaeon]